MSSKLLSDIGKGISSGFVEAEVVERKECSGSCGASRCEGSLDECEGSLDECDGAASPEERDKTRWSSDDGAYTDTQEADLCSASLEGLERRVSLVKAVDRS